MITTFLTGEISASISPAPHLLLTGRPLPTGLARPDVCDGLGAALKGIIDGIADALGLKNDRDARVRWVLDQRRSERGVYRVDVRIEPAEPRHG